MLLFSKHHSSIKEIRNDINFLILPDLSSLIKKHSFSSIIKKIRRIIETHLEEEGIQFLHSRATL